MERGGGGRGVRSYFLGGNRDENLVVAVAILALDEGARDGVLDDEAEERVEDGREAAEEHGALHSEDLGLSPLAAALWRTAWSEYQCTAVGNEVTMLLQGRRGEG